MKHLLILITVAFLSFAGNDYSGLDLESIAEVENSHWASNAEEVKEKSAKYLRTVLYEGTLNGTMDISLYLKEEEHPCGGDLTILYTMYKYASQEKWLLLSATTDKEKKKYCMVEDGFTGVLFLEDQEGSFQGNWISPDTKKQFKVELEKRELNSAIIEKLDEILFDDLLYNKNDC